MFQQRLSDDARHGHLGHGAHERVRAEDLIADLQFLECVADEETSFVISGNGDVIEPEHDLMAIGSGGSYAQAAALALLQNTDLNARDIVEKALSIAGDICVYTNKNIVIEELSIT